MGRIFAAFSGLRRRNVAGHGRQIRSDVVSDSLAT